MTSKRKMVFGYRIEFVDIIPSPNEAETVQYIYATYLTGASFQHLAKELDKRDVPYDAGKRWNVNMVARILEDSRYIGTEVYPALISAEQLQAVQERRKQKRSIPSRTPAQAELYRLCSPRRRHNLHEKRPAVRRVLPASGPLQRTLLLRHRMYDHPFLPTDTQLGQQ